MEAVWYAILAAMLSVYVALDGFDFGAGILHLVVAKTDEERRTVHAAIGPVWDGNEVWLIASGGVLFFAFPKVYASGFSGFYLPLMMVVWLLALRGLGIELRSQLENPLWRSFWDATFGLASALLALLFGVAFGNLLRGVPVDGDGYFASPLFTDFDPRSAHPGALDLYTLPVGLFAVTVLAGHGALYLAWKTAGEVEKRSLALARWLWWAIPALGLGVTVLTLVFAPGLVSSLGARPGAWPLVAAVIACPAAVHVLLRRKEHLRAFVASCVLIGATLATAAAALYPALLRSTLDPAFTLDAHNAKSGAHGLATGLLWWVPAMCLVVGYTIFVFRTFRGKAQASDHE